ARADVEPPRRRQRHARRCASATGTLSATGAMALNLAATAAALVSATFVLIRTLPPAVRRAAPVGGHRRPGRSILPLLIGTTTAPLVGQVPVILLGILADTDRAGQFAVVKNLGDLALVPLIAFTPIWSASLATLAGAGDHAAMRRMVALWSRRATVFTLPILLVLAVFGEPILRLFGPAFAIGDRALAILCIGYLVMVATGANALALVMARRERAVAVVNSVAMLLSIGLSWLLIPRWGLEGAAVASAAATVALNIATAVMAGRMFAEPARPA
ncbi:MAG: polysaccharide biosynthesis C-terminal domain-containing protein, partial [Pseudomonadota bacterium]